eukprot:SM000076S21779  [mRNA]  locus=s76:181550:184083:+ [translate_table: standard]
MADEDVYGAKGPDSEGPEPLAEGPYHPDDDGGGGGGGGGAGAALDHGHNGAPESSAGVSASSGGKIFIGGLSWETTTEILTEHFAKYGELTDAVIMRDRATGHPRGFGFVTFSDPAICDRVVQDKHVIDGRTVEAKKSVPRGDMTAASSRGPKTRKIFVGGLPPNIMEDDLKRHFDKYGVIVEHQIMQDHSTGRSRGFGFVTFESEQSVEDILAQGKMQELGGKQVEIKKAEPKRSDGGPALERSGYGSRGGYGGGGGGGGGSGGGGTGGGHYGGGGYGGGYSDGYGMAGYGSYRTGGGRDGGYRASYGVAGSYGGMDSSYGSAYGGGYGGSYGPGSVYGGAGGYGGALGAYSLGHTGYASMAGYGDMDGYGAYAGGAYGAGYGGGGAYGGSYGSSGAAAYGSGSMGGAGGYGSSRGNSYSGGGSAGGGGSASGSGNGRYHPYGRN